jgi:hypothetical protein
MSFGIPVRNGLSIGLLASTFLTSGSGRLVPRLTLNFLTGAPLDSRITFSRTTNATLVDATGRVTYAPNNLATYSQELSNAAWSKIRSSITADVMVAPDGTLTGDKLVEDTSVTNTHRVSTAAISMTAGTTYTWSIFLKAGERTSVVVALNATSAGNAFGTNPLFFVDLLTGAITSVSASVTASSAVFITDGWWRVSVSATATLTTTNTPTVLLAVGGTNAYTGDGVSGAFLWGGQVEAVTYQTTPSTYVQTVASAYYGPRFDYDPVTLAPRGLLIEEQRVNSIRNSIGVGAVAGTPGTAPTNWAVAGSGVGFTREIVGTGMENGVSYIDVRFFGTPTANFGVAIAFEGANTIAATSGQTWTNSAYVKLQAGSFVGTQTTLSILGTDGAAGIESFGSANITSTPSNLAASRLSLTATLANALTTFVQPRVRIAVTNGVPFDITLRIGLPQMELGAFATSVIPTATAQVTRAADNATMTGTNFSSWFNASEGTFVASAAVLSTAANRGVYAASDGSGVNELFHYVSTTANNLVTTASVSQANVIISGPVLINTVFSDAFAYRQNDISAAFNGVLGTPDTSATLPVVSQLRLGARGDAALRLNGHLRTLTYYATRLTNAQLQALSA